MFPINVIPNIVLPINSMIWCYTKTSVNWQMSVSSRILSEVQHLQHTCSKPDARQQSCVASLNSFSQSRPGRAA